VTEGIPWLGFVVFPGRMPLKRRRVVTFRRRLRRSLAAAAGNDASAIAALGATLRGWYGHARFGSTTGLIARLLEEHPSAAEALLQASSAGSARSRSRLT
jgi:hypothetical protein